jgi:hypothetical protein
MFDKLKNQMEVNVVKNEQVDFKVIEDKIIYGNYLNTLQNSLIQR